MSKAQPWNVNADGFDAREAAREAASRQGKSLGEWLHGVIADHAEDHGLAPRAVSGQDRIDAVTARLEQMGARPGADHARRGSRARPEPRSRLQRSMPERDHESFDDEDALDTHASRYGERQPQRSASTRDSGDDLLENAVAAMERRTARNERRTDQALASMAKLLEDTQARREREYGDVAALTRKLSDLETNLAQRFATSDNPIKGSLAQLQARLDAIGTRGAAEAAARQSAVVTRAADAAEPLRRRNGRLESTADDAALQPLADLQMPAADVSAAALVGRRHLGEAIAEISRRQRTLEEPAGEERPVSRVSSGAARHPDAAETIAATLRDEMANLAAKVDDIRRDALLARATQPAELDALRNELGAIARTLEGLAPRGSIDNLETSIAVLAKKLETSRENGVRESVLEPVEAAVGDLRHSLGRLDPRETIGGLEEELRRLGDKVDGLSTHDRAGMNGLQSQMEQLRETVATMATRPLLIERIERQVAALVERLDRRLGQLAAYPDTPAEINAATDVLRKMVDAAPAHFEKIESKLDTLSGRLDQALAADTRPALAGTDTRQLEQILRELGSRFDAAQAPGADHATLDSLQRQVEQLSKRFERSETGLSALPTLAASMNEFFSHLEATRESVETSAARAAREVLKIAANEGRQHRDASPEPVLPSVQDKVEARASSTLNTVQDMLDKVVTRLAVMENEISDTSKPAPAAASSAGPSEHVAVASPQPDRAEATAVRPTMGEIRLGAPDASLAADESRRADFIAAARRAASTAQAEAANAKRKAPSEKAARAGLLVKSRDYVASHKRPMLMGVAALMMALGVIALMERGNGFGGGVDLASAPAKPAFVAGMTPVASTKVADATSSNAPPKTSAPLAGATAAIDPVQTASIPRLPTFASGAAPSQPPRPTLPPALLAAAEGGNVAAQYDLANRYSEGRVVPRDMRLAAIWFEKAANAGSAPAQYRLASLYEKGIGVAVDKAKAKALYTKAADAGNPRAMHNLAVLLADGEGHPDYSGAIDWFRKAAQHGVHDSQYNLAVLLARGLGATQNLVQSYQWFSVAAATGDADAEKKRDEVGLKLSADDIAVAKALAASFQPKTPNPVAVVVAPPPGGWDGAAGASRLNSARSKISSL